MMRFNILLLFLMLGVALSAAGQSTSQPLSKGKILTATQVTDLQIKEIVNLKDPKDGKDYSVFWFYGKDNVTIVLTSRDSIYYTVNNVVTHAVPGQDKQVRLSGCKKNGNPDDSVLALVPYDLTDKDIKAVYAWQLELRKKRITPADAKQITCPPLEVMEVIEE